MKASLALLIVFAVLLSALSVFLYVENSRLRRELQSLRAAYNTLLAEYDELRSSYEHLSSEYESLQGEFFTLKSTYEYLREEHERFIEGYSKLRENILGRTFYKPESWPEKIDYKSSEVAYATSAALKAWYYGANPYSKIYGWIKDHIEYNYDTPVPILPSEPWEELKWRSSYWKKASETVNDGYGDCEDLAILAAAMVLNYWLTRKGTTYIIWVVVITGPTAGHAFTIIPVQGGKVIILDPAGSKITGLDLWIYRIVEPEDIGEAITEYVEEWEKHGHYFDTVYAVFNHKEYMILDMSIHEFIKWLYEQTT